MVQLSQSVHEFLFAERMRTVSAWWSLLCEWPGDDTASTVCRLESDVAACIERYTCSIPASNEGAISRQTSLTAVEEWMLSRICRSGPIPVGQVAVISTLIAKGLLVRPNIISMPREKVALNISASLRCCEHRKYYRKMDGPCLLDVCHHEIVVSALRTRGDR
jgi:hypothetical protein